MTPREVSIMVETSISPKKTFERLSSIESIEVSERDGANRVMRAWEVTYVNNHFEIKTIVGTSQKEKIFWVEKIEDFYNWLDQRGRRIEKVNFREPISDVVGEVKDEVSGLTSLEQEEKKPLFQTITGENDLMTPEELKRNIRVGDYLEGAFSRGLVLEVTREKVTFIVANGSYYYVEKLTKPFDEVGKVKRIDRPVGEKSVNLKEAMVNHPEGKRFYCSNEGYIDITKKAGDTLTYILKLQNGKKLQLGIRRVWGFLIENKVFGYTSIENHTFETK